LRVDGDEEAEGDGLIQGDELAGITLVNDIVSVMLGFKKRNLF
jgi:hypothetical protein